MQWNINILILEWFFVYRNLRAVAKVATYTYSTFLKYNVNYHIAKSLLLNIHLVPDGWAEVAVVREFHDKVMDSDK